MQKNTFLLIPVLLLFSCTGNNTGIKPVRNTITESVYASGSVEAGNQYTVYAPVSGTLLKINSIAGSDVAQGEVLFEIENNKERLLSENALLSYRHSAQGSPYIRDRIREMEITVSSASVKADADCSYYERCKKAMPYGGITEAELERASAACRASGLSLDAARKQLSQLTEQLKNEQAMNNISLQINRDSENDYFIKSAMDGVMYDVIVHEGTLITPQTPLAIIGAKDAFVLELEVDENDMAKIAVGQRVLVTMDSYKNKVFEARVDKIYPIIDELTRTFRIEAHFKNPPPILYPNLPVEANIIIRSKNKALIIPREYLIDNSYVLMGNDTKRKVTIGLSDYKYVEIIQGLEDDETIYKPQ